jgi:hypothetical protein
VTILEFDNGVTATFGLSAFTNRMGRTMKIMGEHGEIKVSELNSTIEIVPFASNAMDQCQSTLIQSRSVSSAHGGGDTRLVDDFIAKVEGDQAEMLCSIEKSTESHMMACAAEEARVSGGVVSVAEFRRQHSKG